MTTDAEQAQETTGTEPVKQDDKQTDPVEKRLSQMAAQKNEAREAQATAEKKLADYEADRAKVRDAKLIEDGELKTALQERDDKIEALTGDLNKVSGLWDAHVSHKTEALNTEMDDAKFDDKTKELAMKYTDLDDREDFIKLFKTEKDLPRANTARAGGVKTLLKPLAEMTDQEKRDTHETRIGQYA